MQLKGITLTAKVHIFLSEIMKKSCDKFLPRFDDFVFFVTDSKIRTPDSEFLLEKYQSKSLGKGYPRFIRQIH